MFTTPDPPIVTQTPVVIDISPANQKKYFDFVEGMRAMAALYVVLHHAWVDTWNIFHRETPGRLVNALTGWLAYGHESVTVFIAISGFCLMLPATAKGGRLSSISGFFRRRATRILPPYYAALALSVAVLFIVGHKDWFSVAGLLQHVLLVHDFTTHILEINGPMWSIAVEVQIYLLFPLLLWIMRKTSIYVVLVLTAVVGYSLFARYGMWQGVERDFHYVFIFSLGMYAAWYVSRNRQAKTLIPSILMMLFACVTLAWINIWKLGNFQWTDLFLGLTTCCALIVGALGEHEILARFFSHKILLTLGAFSYSLYLMHKPVQLIVNALIKHLPIGLNEAFLIRAVVGTALAIAVSYGFYLVFEEPFLTRSPKGARTAASTG